MSQSKFKMGKDASASKRGHDKSRDHHDSKASMKEGPSVHMKGKLYSHSPKHVGPDEAGMGKPKSGGKAHKANHGYDEGKSSNPKGAHHAKMSGPGEMRDVGLHGEIGKGPAPVLKAAEVLKKSGNHAYLGDAAKHLKDGHKKLEKVSADSMGGPRYGSESQGNSEGKREKSKKDARDGDDY